MMSLKVLRDKINGALDLNAVKVEAKREGFPFVRRFVTACVVKRGRFVDRLRRHRAVFDLRTCAGG